MPLYFFHLRDGDDVLLDPEGRELAGQASIETAALKEARSIISEDALGGRITLAERIDVEDATGVVVHRIHFVDAVEIVQPKIH